MNRRTIGIVSGKGGTGKTVVAINLALAFYKFGKNVTIVDADVTASNLALQLGIYHFPKTLQNVLMDGIKIKSSIYCYNSSIDFIPSSISLGAIRTDMHKFKKTLEELKGIVLVDSPPGLSHDALNVLDAVDDIIIVTVPEVQTVANALKVIKIAHKKKKHIWGIVLNRCKFDGYELSRKEIEETTEVPIIGEISEEKNMRKSLFQNIPISEFDPYSKATIEFEKIAAKLLDRRYEPPRNLGLKRLMSKLGRKEKHAQQQNDFFSDFHKKHDHLGDVGEDE